MTPSRVPPPVIVGDCERSGLDRVRRPPAFARPKSKTFTTPSGVILMLAGLQVAVDDPFLVRRVQRVGDLARDRQRFSHGQGPGPR